MTVVPVNLRQFKRIISLVLVSLGLFMLFSTLAWIIGYSTGRGFDIAVLRSSFGSEFGYWSPVLILIMPGLLLLFHGVRMLRNVSPSLLEVVEVLALVVTVIVIGLIILTTTV